MPSFAMSASAKSLVVFAVYLFLLGLGLIIVPNAILGLFGLAPTTDVWIRIIGVVALNLAYYSFRAARAGLVQFIRWSVHGRLIAPAFFVCFVALGLAPWQLLLFALVDAAAATWTYLALRADRRAGALPFPAFPGTSPSPPRSIREEMERNVPTAGS